MENDEKHVKNMLKTADVGHEMAFSRAEEGFVWGFQERERSSKSFEALQERVSGQLDEVENRASRGSKRRRAKLIALRTY